MEHEEGDYLSDMTVVSKGMEWSGPWQASTAKQDQQRADHTLTVPSAELLANSAALLSLPSPNCTRCQDTKSTTACDRSVHKSVARYSNSSQSSH